MAQSRTIHEVVIADLVSCCFDTENHFRVTEGPLANEEKGCLGVVLAQNLEDLRCEGRVWTIIERKSNQVKIRRNSIGDVGSQSFEHTQGIEGLYPEH
jgi:hypothetical protein